MQNINTGKPWLLQQLQRDKANPPSSVYQTRLLHAPVTGK